MFRDLPVLDRLSIDDQQITAQLKYIAREADNALDQSDAVEGREKYDNIAAVRVVPLSQAPVVNAPEVVSHGLRKRDRLEDGRRHCAGGDIIAICQRRSN